MSTTLRAFVAPMVAVLSLALAGTAIAAPSASIEQVRNGTATAGPSTPGVDWVSGNAGKSNSHYLESHSIAYRAVMGDLPTDGTVVELVIGYAVKKSDSYAIDFLTHYQRLVPHVGFGHPNPEVINPLAGVTGVGSTVTTAQIPPPTKNLMIDPDGAESEPAALQPLTSMSQLSSAEQAMTLFGGTLIDVSYVSEGDVTLATGTSETQVKVRFVPTSPKAVLAWGGHIACRWDWGFNPDGTPRSAGGISGSSYHMNLVTWNLGSLGSQDRSLSTDAVYPVPRCGISNAGPFCAGSTNTHTAPSGMESYHWTLYDNTSGATIVGSDTGLSVVVHSATGGSYGLMLSTGASGFSKQCQGVFTVLPPAMADAGLDQIVCSTSPQVQLAGQAAGGGSTMWSGGAGTFSPSASVLNASYTPSASEISAGSVTLTLTSSTAGNTCPPVTDRMTITIQRAPTANAGVNLTVCASSPLAQLAGSVGGSASGGVWSGGAGTFTPSASALNATYLPSPEEIAAGNVTLTLTTITAGGPCAQGSDQVTILISTAATANAGADLTVCTSSAQAQLVGTVGGGAVSGLWSGGAGSYNPNASNLNAIYTPTAAEIAAGGVTLTLTTNDPAGPCPAVNDQVRITISPAATANAGIDQSLCSTSPQAQLAGVVGGGATSGSWSGGGGSFSPDASTLNASYMPTAAEIAAGGVTLTLTTNDPAGPCAAGVDQVRINILPAAIVSAGIDQSLCSTSPQVQLAGVVGGGAATGAWSGGGGSYSPNALSLNAVYTPSAAEIAAGGVTLTLTSNDPAGPCAAGVDQVHITISPVATVNAGIDQSLCSTSPQAQLAGVVGGGATSGGWSGGTGSYNPSASSLNAVYTPSAAELAAGGVTLTLTTNDPAGPCAAGVDQVRINILPAAIVSAGIDQSLCSTSPQVQLAGVVGGGAATGAWSGGGGSYSPNASSLNAIYTPSAAEIAAGGVTLTLTSNDPAGPCAAGVDQVHITISPVATVNAGIDQSLCSTSPQAQLAGVVGGGAASGTWSGGTGSYNPSASNLNAVYTPSAAEIAAGGVTLTLTTNDPAGPCVAATDQVRINILPAATANAGVDQSLCATSPQVQLAGVLGGGATSGTWSGGAGSYSPNASTLNAIYTPTAAEIAGGNFTLTLTTNDPAGPCAATSDQVRINVFPAAVANAGIDQNLCSTSPQAQLAAVVWGGTTSGTWSGGAGSFNPSASSLNAIYTPTAAEIAAGSVTLTLTTSDPVGPCAATTDQVRLNFLPAAITNAGADLTVCATSPQVQLAGAVGGGATSGQWSGGTGTFSPNATNLNASYTPSAAEIAAGSVTLTLTTNDPAGPCAAGTDQVRIIIVPAATVNAGPDQSLCSSSPQVQLMGSVGGSATGGIWSGGTGTFNPSATALGAKYTPSAVEIANGSVTLTLTTTPASGTCPPASDQVTILFGPAATVNAGPDQLECAAFLTSLQLAGSIGGSATSATWSGGTGTFTPSASSLNALYTPSAGDVAAGSVTLTLTTNDPAGPCPAVSDQMKITIFSPRVTVADRMTCNGMTAQMCATPSNGVAPYRYLWSNGVTTQCWTVADTGRYTVTITDAMGCQATGSGQFRFRDCPGMIAHTSATCGSFLDGTAAPLLNEEVNWVVKDNIITSIAPGVFFYFTKVTAPSSSFTVNIVQTKDNPSFPYCEVQQGQIALSTGECNRLPDGAETGPGQASLSVTGATAGQVYIINVKYSLKTLVGTYMDETMGCLYNFKTVINGVVVDQDPEGLQIGTPRPVVVVTNTPDIPEEPTEDLRLRRSDPGAGQRTPSSPDTAVVGGGGNLPEESTEDLRLRGGDTSGGLRGASSPDTAGVTSGVRVAPVSGSSPAAGEAFSGVSGSPWEYVQLERATPNPFSAHMRMAYEVGSASERVSIGVYDIAGRLVRTLASEIQSAGRHAVVWDGRDQQGTRVQKGMYFVHVRIGERAKQVRVTMLQ